MITGNEPSMPVDITIIYPQDVVDKISHLGLTIRQQFAMAAMQGLLASTNGTFSASHLAYTSVQAADALIAELNKTTEP